ncbi:LexA family protein [Dialister invisus]|uniref:LexA family protein n=1 Tax=Dialister invisus TaxID=218538 RepID=UPI00265B2C83|nr:XRE family transcriptional regulator [Dialister invisus]
MSDLGNKKVFSKNLRKYMDLYQKSRNDICKDLGFAYTTFTSWETGVNYPRIDKIEMMADYFHIEKSDLIEDKTDKPSSSAKGIRIPVLGRVAAGIPIEAITDIEDREKIPQNMAKTGEYFALKIAGKSMEPRMMDGDVVIVRRQPDVDSGDIAVVLVNGNDATVKQISKSDAGLTLIGWNPSVYTPKTYNKKECKELPVTILGKVVEIRGKL